MASQAVGYNSMVGDCELNKTKNNLPNIERGLNP